MYGLSQRKPNRLSNYDYSQNGVYFITFCTEGGIHYFWTPQAVQGLSIENPLSDVGKVVYKRMAEIPDHYPNVKMLHMVVMPNHVHLLLALEGDLGKNMDMPTVSRMIKQAKGAVTKDLGQSLWQGSFHDHVVRNPLVYTKVWSYIEQNPMMWADDCFAKPHHMWSAAMKKM